MVEKYRKEARVQQLMLMDEFMRTFNDEEDLIPWYECGVPDGANENDYEDIAEDDDEYNEIFNLFIHLVKRPGARH